MGIRDLSSSDRELARECLAFCLNGSVFEGDEYHIRIGLDFDELKAVLDEWPEIGDDDREGDASLAVNNCFNEVCNGLSISDRTWGKWFSAPLEAVCEAFAHWRASTAKSPT